MEKTVKADCPDHGEVYLRTSDINALVWQSDHRSQYRFSCPKDGVTVLKETEFRIVKLLVDSGVELSIIDDEFMYSDIAQNTTKAEECGLLDWDSLIDFHEGLKRLDENIMTEITP